MIRSENTGDDAIHIPFHRWLQIPSELDAFSHQRAPQQDSIGSIDAQNADRRPANRRFPHELCSRPPKMYGPSVLTRIEQPRHFTCLLISPGEIRAFVRVATEARPAKVLGAGRAAVFRCHHMVSLEAQLGDGFRQMAILAPETRALSDLPAQARTHEPRSTCLRQATARLRFQKLQSRAHGAVVLQFRGFITRNLSLRRTCRQRIGPIQIALTQLQIQQSPRGSSVQRTACRLDGAFPDGDAGS